MTAALTSVSGALYARYGGMTFLAMGALCLIALPFAWYGFADRPDRAAETAPRRPAVGG